MIAENQQPIPPPFAVRDQAEDSGASLEVQNSPSDMS